MPYIINCVAGTQFYFEAGNRAVRTSEVENLLGIDKETIRFYIRRGLFTPAKDKYGHRDYSEEDVQTIKKILIMRDLELSVSQIKDILSGDRALTAELEGNLEALYRKRDTVESAIGICLELIKQNTNDFDPEQYYHRF